MGGLRRRFPLTGSAVSSALVRWTQPGVVKSVQRNTITITGATSNTATIASVDVNNARLRYLGNTCSANDTDAQSRARIALTNATTVTATVNTSPGADTVVVSFEVTEYFPGVIRTVQRGTVVNGSPATINPVNVAKSDLDFLGASSGDAAAANGTLPNIVLTNSTTVTCSATLQTETASYQVIEWY